MARSTDEYSHVFNLRQLEAALMAKQLSPLSPLSPATPPKTPASNNTQNNIHPTLASPHTPTTRNSHADGQDLHMPAESAHSSERTPTQPDSADEDDGDADEVEFVLEVTPIQSEIDSESVAGVSTMSDIFSVSSQNHRGSGVACRYYNRGRCFKGTSCPYSHASDQYSLRSHPEGHNVCLYFIHNDKCRYTEQQCNYSHRRSDLYWNDEELQAHLAEAIANKRKENAKIGKGRAVPTRNRSGDKLARPTTTPAQSSRTIRTAPRQINRDPVAVTQLLPPLQSLVPLPRMILRIPGVQKLWEREMAIRLANASLVDKEISTVLSYGTPKPWDDGAWLRLDQICGYPVPYITPFVHVQQYPENQHYLHRGIGDIYPF